MYSILVAARNGEATLADVIEAGDVINHAIFMPNEINGGLGRLERAGFVTLSGGSIRPSQTAIDLYASARIGSKYAMDVMTHLGELMGPAWKPRADGSESDSPTEPFDANTIQSACAEYQEKFQERLARLRERDP